MKMKEDRARLTDRLEDRIGCSIRSKRFIVLSVAIVLLVLIVVVATTVVLTTASQTGEISLQFYFSITSLPYLNNNEMESNCRIY